jgi:hypothetical protein
MLRFTLSIALIPFAGYGSRGLLSGKSPHIPGKKNHE